MADNILCLFTVVSDEDHEDVSPRPPAVLPDGGTSAFVASDSIFTDRQSAAGAWLSVPPAAAAAPAAAPLGTTPAAAGGSGEAVTSVPRSGDPTVDSSLVGLKWADGAITYGDPDAPTDYQAGYLVDENGDSLSAQNQGFSQLTAQQMVAVHFALSAFPYSQPTGAAGFSVAGFTNLDIDYAGPGAGTGTIRIANTSDARTAYGFYPGTFDSSGDVWLGATVRAPVAGNYAWYAVLHELGHALGLKHGHEEFGFGALPADVDSLEFSLMTYSAYIGQSAVGTLTFEQWGAPQTFMMLDIAALQYLYGADYTVNSTDTVYTWSPTGGETFVNGNLAIDPGGNRIFATIWDGGGTDTYDLSNYTTGVTLDLGPGDHSVFSTGQLARLGGGPNGGLARGNIFNALEWHGDPRSLIENAVGGSAADVLMGNAIGNRLTGNAGDDRLLGEGGDDVLDGGLGVDSLYGDAGNDTLVYDAFDARIDGGSGTDTLRIDGRGISVDLTLIGNDVIADVEIIDLGARGNGLVLGLSDASALSPTHTVRIDGGAGDRVVALDARSWLRGADQAFGSNTYRIYTQAGTTLLVDSDIVQEIAGAVPTVATSAGQRAFVESAGNSTIPAPGILNTLTVDTGLTVSGVGGPTLTSASVSITQNFRSTQDELVFVNDGIAMGNITGSYARATGVMTLASAGGTASLSEWQAALRAVAYGNVSDVPDTSTRVVSFAVFDGSAGSTPAAKSITVTSVNDAPVNSVAGAQRMPDHGKLTIVGTHVTDPDASMVQVTLSAAHGALSLAPGSAASLTFTVGDGVADPTMTFSGTTAAANAALGTLTYASGSQFAGTDTITLTTSDLGGTGAGGALSDSDSMDVLIAHLGLIVDGGPGNDRLFGVDGNDTLTGSGGADILAGEAGDDWIEGETGNDPLPFGELPGDDIIAGGPGNDTILAGGGNDLVHGDAGNDIIVGEAGADVIYGLEGVDAIDGGSGGDVLFGGDGADILFGSADSDTLYGGEGNDIMMGERGEASVLGALDVLYGEGGNDLMDGGAGNDWLFGGDGVDVIDGDYGSDIIMGGPGADLLVGSAANAFTPERAGSDLFIYTWMGDAGDRIWGFDTRAGENDGIDLRSLFDSLGYAGLTPRLDGFMSVTQGATATDAVVSIDPNGGGDSYSVLLTLHGVTPASLTDAFFLFQ